MQIYSLKYKHLNQQSYLFISNTHDQLYLFGAFDINQSIMTYLYSYTNICTHCFSYPYFLLAFYHVFEPKNNLIIKLNVLSLNFRSLSVYSWIGYQLFHQRKTYYNQASEYTLSLVFINMQSKNSLKRFLVSRYFEESSSVTIKLNYKVC